MGLWELRGAAKPDALAQAAGIFLNDLFRSDHLRERRRAFFMRTRGLLPIASFRLLSICHRAG
jgi:hypothetical protein